ncbi:FkbM family methyltransferase [Cyclobacterium plantarum]|uniref:FkbM family methyltransferase n=1 Tax=Cyclobacterium plantarum TaxID=2716263 RepID=A0ABX0H975_9BACT|nr:FkbM family methyltransferase [Cyclobacterium plantarum]NHE56972.1 FkbM family methyltransferase [Cyclobacterium plantarum]
MKSLFLPLKRKLQSQWKALRFQLSASNNPAFVGFYKYFYNPGKGSLSEFLSSYSLSKRSGFTVIQIGANDGITHDPIHKFIKRDRWKGVLLEPQPDVYHQFLKKIYAKNEGIKTVCAAIGEKDGTQPIFKIGFSNMRWATGLTSFSREKIEQAFEEGIVATNCEKFGIEIPEDKNKWISQEEVEVIAPDTLIQRYGLDHIDLLQIDAEGYDLEVIRIFDIPKSQPEAVVFENVGLKEADYAACLSLLQDNGYGTRKFGPNTLALKRSNPLFSQFFER